MNFNHVAIQETFDLPSGGRGYPNGQPKSVTLRAMTTMEEKQRLAGNGFGSLINLIQSCVVDENVKVEDLSMFDVLFLMYKLRIVTYGSDYKLYVVCPSCGEEVELVVNLDNLETIYADDDYTPNFIIDELPISHDKVEARLITAKDILEIEREGRKIKQKFPKYEGDPEYIARYVHKIVSINGETPVYAEVQNWVETLNARDLRQFDIEYAKIDGKYGIQTEINEICPKCGEEISRGMPVTSEFFRPTY